MAVMFLFVFAMVMTIFAFYGDGSQSAAERAEQMGAVPAGQMVALHAAMARACAAQPGNCPANANVNKFVAAPYLSPPYSSASRPFQDGDYRYGTWFDGTTLYTYYTGIQGKQTFGDAAGAQMRGSVTAWLDANMPKDSMGNIGTYDAVNQRFVARGYSSTTRYNGTAVTTPSFMPVTQVYPGAGIPSGAPLIRTRVRG